MKNCLKRLPFVGDKDPVVNVIRLDGVIAAGGRFKEGLSMQSMAETIEKAFKPKDVKAIALVINSPGGSPAQSSLIARRIRTLAEENNKPVYAFVEDVAASGGYYLACAADEVFVDHNSIVGSIGVIYAGFGFVEAIKKLGVERRLYTAGENKSMLDPFQPKKKTDLTRLQGLQDQLHDAFIDYVKERRGDKLKGEDEALFNGDIWVGDKAIEQGLVDGLGDLRSVMRARFGDKVELKMMNQEAGWLKRKLGLSNRPAPASLLADMINELEAQAQWNRFGL